MAFTPSAGRQVRALRQYYQDHDRPEAIRALASALDRAWQVATTNPAAGLPVPRPYPQLSRPGVARTKAGRYCIAYSLTPPPTIVGVYFETADIPHRL